MATSAVFTVLANIPWSQVIEKAPKVLDGASRLWKTVANRKKTNANSADLAAQPASTATHAEILNIKIAELEENVRVLQDQIQESTELIKTLAEQNSQLIVRVELNRNRLTKLSMALAVLSAGCIAAIFYTLMR